MADVAELDKEEADEREGRKNRTPQVAQGLFLPDENGVYALDEYRGTPELIELDPAASDLEMARRHGVRSILPLAGQLAHLELGGASSGIHIHIDHPIIYLSLDAREDGDENEATASSLVESHTAGATAYSRHAAISASSGFAIVHAEAHKSKRIVGTVHISPAGSVTQDEAVIPATAELLPGKHWLKLTLKEPLKPGEYALVEILSVKEMNATVWDFDVNPQSANNDSAIIAVKIK